MRERSLQVLETLVNQAVNKTRRLKEFLKDPETEGSDGWFMAVPECFNYPLDIKRTEVAGALEWTQGRRFEFKVGDVLYDTLSGYDVWTKAIKKIQLAVQVETASSVGNGRDGEWYRGSVTFVFLTPDKERFMLIKRGSHTMTQDDFVRFLIAGPEGELKSKIDGAK